MRRIATALTAACFLASGAPGALAADSANLGPTFKQGEKSRYELTNKATQVINAPQGEMTIIVESTVTLACVVEEIDESGAALVRTTVEGVKTSFQTPMMSETFDSASPAENDGANQIAALIRPVVGQSFTVELDAEGANADVQGVENLIPAGQAGSLVAQAIGAQGLGTAVVGFYVLKDGHDPIEEGAEWSEREDSAAPPLGTVSITTNSKLEDIADGRATVKVDGEAEFTPSPDAAAQGMSMTIDESDISGVVSWNTEIDMLQEVTSKSLMAMTVTMAAMPEAKQTVRVETSSTTRRLD